jgi:hypothetical protein
MDQATFESSMNSRSPEASVTRLTKRFNHAFRATQDLQSAMAAVNELLDRPLTYQEFFAALRK